MANVQVRNSEFVGNLVQDYWARKDTLLGQAMAISLGLNISGLRAFWPFSVSRTAGTIPDISSNGLDLTASGAGAVASTLDNSLTPIATFNGADQFTRAHGAEFTSGLAVTEGGWVYPTVVSGVVQGIIGKWRDDGAAERSHLLYFGTTGLSMFSVSAGGAAATNLIGPALPLNTWSHVVARFIPSTEMAIFINGRKVAFSVAAIPAGFFTGGAKSFAVGASHAAPLYFTGSLGYQFYAVNAINDGSIFSLFEGSRAAFGI